MPSWLLKAVVQGIIATMPQSYRWNRLLQETISRSLNPVKNFDDKLVQWLQHVQHSGKTAPDAMEGVRALELGMGVFPVISVALFLSGASIVHAFDIAPLCTRADVRTTLRLFLARAQEGRLPRELPHLRTHRLDVLREVLEAPGDTPVGQLLAKCHVRYHLADAGSTSLPDGSIEFFLSNNTLEHIPAQDISRILKRFRRLATRGAVMTHLIDMADHYAQFDRSIGPLNYLKYPSWKWRVVNNALQYQNRLRLSDYRRLFTQSGWHICFEQAAKTGAEALQTIHVAPEFFRYSQEDLLTTAVWITCQTAELSSVT